MMELILKYALHGIITGIGMLAVASVKYLWKIVKLGESNNILLKEVLKEVKDSALRIDVGDVLFSRLYGTSVSTRMIIKNQMDYPEPKVHRKIREDH